MNTSTKAPHPRSVQLVITEKVPVVPPHFSIAETSTYLAEHIKGFDSIDYLYIVDGNKKLRGVLSIKDVYRHDGHIKISDIAKKTPFVTVSPTGDQEEAAYKAVRNGIKAVPVVDENQIFYGAVTHDAVTRILHREMREDVLKLAGIRRGHVVFDDVMTTPLIQAVKRRFPWLFVGMIGGLLAAKIIGFLNILLRKTLSLPHLFLLWSILPTR